jgi:GTP pyrophosphokinase
MSERELIQKVKRYNPRADVKLIQRAYEFARQSHSEQYRRSGEEYILHPLGVAQILADLELDTSTIAAGLLHDVVEDAGVTVEKVEEGFGKEIAEMVDGVTKLGRLSFKTAEEAQAENLRKMLIAVARDIRVILIKLADRLHNMRTLSYLGQKKQLEKASETLEIYAPLAHRLGISQLKWELEDLAFQALEPKKYSQIQKMVAERRLERQRYVNELVEILKNELRKVGIKSEIQGRAKHFYSIYQKMVQQGKEFNEIYDLIAVRVLVDTVKDCYGALGVIHSLWKPVPGRFKDYIAMPKFNMYQSLHTTAIGPMGRPLEIQVRTRGMHRTAEYGIAAHWMYKEKAKDKGTLVDRLAWFRQVLDWQKEMKDPREFMETLKIDLFQNEVFVFTPKGQVVSLPAGSTPIDFAYSVHTDVGHRCVGARVNKRIVPLEYKLRNGDIVEILTSKTAGGPSRDWLTIVQSSRARNKIRQWFSKESREDSEHLGKESLQRAIKKQGLDIHELTRSDLMQTVVKDLNFIKLEDLYASVGMGKTSPQHVVTRLVKELSKLKQEVEPGPELEEEIPTVREEIAPVGVRVKGIEGVLTRLARCCNPVPRDSIVGFITRGRGISVHRRDCPNMKELLETPDRIIEVGWDTKQPATFPVEIQVEALDRTKLLRDISTVISDAGLNILSANVSTGRNQTAISRFVVEIGNIDHLQNILSSIKKIDAVYDAYRVLPKKSKQRSS